jgi:cytochrome c553
MTSSHEAAGAVLEARGTYVPQEDKMKMMRYLLFFLSALPILAQPKPSNALVARGEYLVTVGGCGDCHTPKTASWQPDTTRLLSGSPSSAPAPSRPQKPGEVVSSAGSTAFHGPWGISYAANLTPDQETGLAKEYTEASFIKALRTGKSPDGGSILPPMPWENYAKMTDDDLKAVWAYLQSIKPVKNRVKPPVHAAAKKAG